MSFDINGYFRNLNDGSVILSHKGTVTSDLISDSLERVESRLTELGESSRIKKKVYNVLVESLQNLYHHVDELPEGSENEIEPHFGMFTVRVLTPGEYRITTGNFVSSSKVKTLKDKIDKINSLTHDELKDMYKFILNHQKLSAKGGGGLGLVDIARKTGKKLNYGFEHYDDKYYFFSLDILIS